MLPWEALIGQERGMMHPVKSKKTLDDHSRMASRPRGRVADGRARRNWRTAFFAELVVFVVLLAPLVWQLVYPSLSPEVVLTSVSPDGGYTLQVAKHPAFGRRVPVDVTLRTTDSDGGYRGREASRSFAVRRGSGFPEGLRARWDGGGVVVFLPSDENRPVAVRLDFDMCLSLG